MSSEIRKKVDVLVGKSTDGAYYWLDEVFEHRPDFRGAVLTVFRPVSRSEAENAIDPESSDTQDRFKECWKEAVKAGSTDDSFLGWLETVLDSDGIEASFDLSGYDNGQIVAELHTKENELTEDGVCEFSECIGGGRCFSRDMEWEKIYDQAALDLAMSYEK